MSFPSSSTFERLPWWLRILLGALASAVTVTLTDAIPILHSTPLLLGFPAIILCAFYLDLAGNFACALTQVTLVDYLLNHSRLRFGGAYESLDVRMVAFFLVATAMGVMVRRLADAHAEIRNRELNESLLLAEAEKGIAEERARAGRELRSRDELLEIALRANCMGVWVWDIAEGMVVRSEEVYRMSGRDPSDFEADEHSWFKIVHPDDREELERLFTRARQECGDYQHEYRVIWPDGSIHWLETRGKCVIDADGRLGRIVGVMTDVTHRKRSEDALLRAEKLAVAGRLAASVAHEINNPLEAITNLLYLVTLSDTLEMAQEQAERALDEVQRVSLVTQSTLKFHRQTGSPKICMLSEIVGGVVDLFRPRFTAAGVSVELETRSEVAVACMPSEAQQIFANLVANAIEAMPREGRLAIRIHQSRDWSSNGAAGVRVTFFDNGVGMDKETLARIFEPFFTTKSDTGTGLGMWVVAQLVERHRGHVHVRTRPRFGASGTAISVFLPVDPTAMQGVEVEAGSAAAIQPAQPARL